MCHPLRSPVRSVRKASPQACCWSNASEGCMKMLPACAILCINIAFGHCRIMQSDLAHALTQSPLGWCKLMPCSPGDMQSLAWLRCGYQQVSAAPPASELPREGRQWGPFRPRLVPDALDHRSHAVCSCNEQSRWAGKRDPQES